MPTTDNSVVEIRPWVDSLLRMGELARALLAESSGDDAERCRAELSELRRQIPPAIYGEIGSLLESGRPAVAPVERQKCGACHLSVPRGDYFPVLAGKRVMICHHCGVLLYADEAERERAGFVVPSKRRETTVDEA